MCRIPNCTFPLVNTGFFSEKWAKRVPQRSIYFIIEVRKPDLGYTQTVIKIECQNQLLAATVAAAAVTMALGFAPTSLPPFAVCT